MDTLENLINTDFEDYEGSNEFNEPAPGQSKSCELCGYKHSHAKGCPNAAEEEHQFSTDETDLDELTTMPRGFSVKDGVGSWDKSQMEDDDFSEFGDDDFKTEDGDDEDLFDKLDFEDEATEKHRDRNREFDIDEITNMINQSVKEKLGKYFE